MRIFTNPGSNLSPRCLQHYGVAVAPQHIVVDGKSLDTREPYTLADVDRWAQQAKELPHVVGTTAQEFIDLYLEAFKQERELLGVFTTRKIIRSYQAAESAARTLLERPAYADRKVSLVDSGVTDVGAALICIAAAESLKAGRSVVETVALAERMARQGHLHFYIHELDRMVRGGRASFLRAWLAQKLDRRPILHFVDGEIASLGTVRSSTTPAAPLVDSFEQKLGSGRRVWVGIAHGGIVDQAHECLVLCRRRFKVDYGYIRPISSSIYLHGGPRCLMLGVYPVDQLELPRPPPDLDA